jgi:hypothetical protein
MTELRNTYITDANTGLTAGLDDMSGDLAVISFAHHEIHQGSTFTAEVHDAGGAAVNIAFKTPAGTKRAHMIFSFTTESKAHLDIVEGPSWDTNTGTVVVPTNCSRNSSTTSILLEDKSATPSFTANGVLINVTNIAGGAIGRAFYTFSGKNVGGESGARQEMILAVNETYVLLLTSDDGSKGLQLRVEWYEHTDVA